MVLCYCCGRGEPEEIAAVKSLEIRIQGFGIGVENEWLQMQDLLLEENAQTGIYDLKQEDGVALMLTRTVLTDVTALVELDMLGKRFRKGKVTVYTVLYHLEQKDLPNRLKWIEKTRLMTVGGIMDLKAAAAVIARDCWKSRCSRHKSTEKADAAATALVQDFGGGPDAYLTVLHKDYEALEQEDVRLRLLLLVLWGQYLFIQGRPLKCHENCVNALFDQVCSGVPLSALEIEIIQYCIGDFAAVHGCKVCGKTGFAF